MVVEQRLYTVEEFEQIADSPENRDRLLELVNGVLTEKTLSEQQAIYIGNIFGHIRHYLQQTRSGRVVMEVRHRAPGDSRNARIPDISYIAGNRPPVEQGSVPQMPDLAVEVKSPDDSWKTMREKARYYLAHGSKMVWLVHPEKRFVEVYTLDEELVLFEDDILSGGEVLPGFQMRVRDIFEDTAGA